MICAGKVYVEYPSRSDVFTLWPVGDLHVMSRGFSRSYFQRDRERILSSNRNIVIGMGDYAEFISPKGNDKRWDFTQLSNDVTAAELNDVGRAATTRVVDLWRPMRARTIGMLMGNHEHSYEKHQATVMDNITNALDVWHMGYECLFDLVFVRMDNQRDVRIAIRPPVKYRARYVGRDTYTARVHAHHGRGSARTPGGKLNMLYGFVQRWNADIFLAAHVHDQIAKPFIKLEGNRAGTKVVERRVVGAITGSYLRTYTDNVNPSYGEVSAYDGVPLGAARVNIHPHERRLSVETE